MRPLLLASLLLWLPTWIDWWFTRSELAGAPYPLWVGAALALNIPITRRLPGAKRVVVARLQRHLINPVVRVTLRAGIPLGWALLETRGRRTQRVRRVPVGNGRLDADFWLVAEHGRHAGYVHNLRADPTVRLKLRGRGLRMQWVEGHAEIRPDLDPLEVQRRLGGIGHPLRTLNALIVRVLGTELLVVRIRLHDPGSHADPARPAPVSFPRRGGEPPSDHENTEGQTTLSTSGGSTQPR